MTSKLNPRVNDDSVFLQKKTYRCQNYGLFLLLLLYPHLLQTENILLKMKHCIRNIALVGSIAHI